MIPTNKTLLQEILDEQKRLSKEMTDAINHQNLFNQRITTIGKPLSTPTIKCALWSVLILLIKSTNLFIKIYFLNKIHQRIHESPLNLNLHF